VSAVRVSSGHIPRPYIHGTYVRNPRSVATCETMQLSREALQEVVLAAGSTAAAAENF
jgi:hypothetical protein